MKIDKPIKITTESNNNKLINIAFWDNKKENRIISYDFEKLILSK